MLFTGIATFSFALFFCWLSSPDSALSAIKLFAIASALACLLSFIVTVARTGVISKPIESVSNTDEISSATNNNGCFIERDKFLTASRAMFIISLAALATQQLSILVLARSASIADVGIFSLALKISLLISYPLIAINAITAPLFARYFANEQLTRFRTLAFDTRKILLVVATLTVLLLFFSIEYIALFFGESYLPIVPIVKILSLGQWFNLATGSVVSMLLMAGFEKLHRRNTLIITSANIVLLLVLVPQYGVYAAAWVTAVAIAIKNIVSLYFVNKLILTPVKNELL